MNGCKWAWLGRKQANKRKGKILSMKLLQDSNSCFGPQSLLGWAGAPCCADTSHHILQPCWGRTGKVDFTEIQVELILAGNSLLQDVGLAGKGTGAEKQCDVTEALPGCHRYRGSHKPIFAPSPHEVGDM